MATLTPEKKRKAKIGCMIYILIFTALTVAIILIDKKYPSHGPSDREQDEQLKRKALEQNYRDNIKPHLPDAR